MFTQAALTLLKPSSYHSSRPTSKEDTMKFTLGHEAWRRAEEGGGGGGWGGGDEQKKCEF